MSLATKSTAKSLATIWPLNNTNVNYNGYGGGVAYGAPYTVNVCFMSGGTRKYSDNTGIEFTPQKEFWYELPAQGLPNLGDYIAIGDQTATLDPTVLDDAKPIRVAQLQDCSLLNEIDDVMVLV